MAATIKRPNTQALPNSNGHAAIRAVLYARVSTEEQRERQSIQTQIDYARQQCEREGLALLEIYMDEGVSGTIPFEQRPDGRRLLEDARAKKFNLVLVYKVDRLGRADLVSHVAMHHMETLGVGLRSLTEPFDLSSPHGRFMFSIFAGYASLERSNFLERSAAGTSRVARAGKWIGGMVPYGYFKGEDGYLAVNEDIIPGTTIPEAEVVRMIYRWAAERQSTLKIARKLNEMGIPPHYAKDGRRVLRGKRKVHTAGKWHAGRVGNLIHNTTYMGVHVWGKRTKNPNKEQISREVPAIVSPELWQKAQDALRKNLHWSPRNKQRDYLLSGLLTCGFCRRSLTGVTIKRETKHGAREEGYYRCNSNLTHVKDAFGSCQGRHVAKEWLEGLVWGELQDWILHHTNLEQIITEALQEQDRQRQEWRDTLGRMRADIARNDQERSRTLTMYRKGLMSDSELESQLAEVDAEKRRLGQAANELEQRHDLHVNLADAVTMIRQQLGSFREAIRQGVASYQTRREIVEAFVKEIRVFLRKDGKKIGQTTPMVKETLPFRPEAMDSPTNGKRGTVWQRQDNGGSPVASEEGTVQIVYRFPFPPKPRELVSITQRTGTDSSHRPA